MALQVNDILNQAQTLIDDTSRVDRQRLLIWLNQLMKSIADMRDWPFLTTFAELVITDGEVTLPADFKEFINLAIGDSYFYDRTSLYTDSESWIQFGVETDTGIDLPVTTGTATLKYKMNVPSYTHGDTTVFPDEFINVFVDGLLSKYYKNTPSIKDNGGIDITQYSIYKQLFDEGLRDIKKNYNRNQPIPKYTKRGYIRRRQ